MSLLPVHTFIASVNLWPVTGVALLLILAGVGILIATRYTRWFA